MFLLKYTIISRQCNCQSTPRCEYHINIERKILHLTSATWFFIRATKHCFYLTQFLCYRVVPSMLKEAKFEFASMLLSLFSLKNTGLHHVFCHENLILHLPRTNCRNEFPLTQFTDAHLLSTHCKYLPVVTTQVEQCVSGI